MLALLVVAGQAAAEPIERVDAKHVCMVNNTVFDKDQIAVNVDGKTYFGCCDVQAGRLRPTRPRVPRRDPVTASRRQGRRHRRDAGRQVLRFENDKTFSQYKNRA